MIHSWNIKEMCLFNVPPPPPHFLKKEIGYSPGCAYIIFRSKLMTK